MTGLCFLVWIVLLVVKLAAETSLTWFHVFIPFIIGMIFYIVKVFFAVGKIKEENKRMDEIQKIREKMFRR